MPPKPQPEPDKKPFNFLALIKEEEPAKLDIEAELKEPGWEYKPVTVGPRRQKKKKAVVVQ